MPRTKKRKIADGSDIVGLALQQQVETNGTQVEEMNVQAQPSVPDAKVGDELEDDFVALGPLDESNDDNDHDDDDDDEDDGENDNGDDLVDAQSATAAAAAAIAASIPANYDSTRDLPPWMKEYVDYHQVNLLVALHNEIIAFCKLMEPRPDEIQERQELVNRFTALVKETFSDDPDCRVDVFGSQATGLFLPTSDIDIAIQLKEDRGGEMGDKSSDVGEGEANGKKKMASRMQELDDLKNWDKPAGSPLQRLAAALREDWLEDLSYLEVIENTRVPLVKFTHAPTNISIDVCFNQKTGPQAAALMHQYMNALPPLRPLTFVLKHFMASRGLNQPYTGGVGSFLLQMMIVSFLQHRERDSLNNRRASQYNLGALLVEFLEFYSTDFNYILTGVSVRFDGFFFPKGAAGRRKDFWQPSRPFSIAMENPLDPTHDVGSPSFRISTVQRAFEVAFKMLLCHVSEPAMPTVSILAKILPPSSYEDMWVRAMSPTGAPIVDTGTPSDTPTAKSTGKRKGKARVRVAK
jgi:non-canonical poly(A) RNA polymerase PAPD5/7